MRVANFNVANVPIDSDIGYFIECNLRYPEYLHDAQRLYINANMLSDMLRFMMGKIGTMHLPHMELILNLYEH